VFCGHNKNVLENVVLLRYLHWLWFCLWYKTRRLDRETHQFQPQVGTYDQN